MDTPDITPYRCAEQLEWKALTVFDGDHGGDGNIDGELRAVTGGTVIAHLPLDIFTAESWDDLHRQAIRRGSTISRGPWIPGQDQPLGQIIADPRTRDAVIHEVRQWCREQIGRDDVTVSL